MSKQTDMTGSEDKPLMDFMIPESEVDQEVTVGDVGHILVPVVVVSRNDGMICFRKTNNIKPEGSFRPETIDEMRKRIIDEQEESTETADEEATEDESKE
jgi:hypothetical protein